MVLRRNMTCDELSQASEIGVSVMLSRNKNAVLPANCPDLTRSGTVATVYFPRAPLRDFSVGSCDLAWMFALYRLGATVRPIGRAGVVYW